MGQCASKATLGRIRFSTESEMNNHDRSKPPKPRRDSQTASSEAAAWKPGAESRPEALAQLDADLILNNLLRELPNAPVPSNFTSRVMEQIQLAQRAAQRPAGLGWWHRISHLAWLRKLVVAGTFLAVGLLSYQQYQMSVRRDLAQSVASLSMVVQPTLDVLQDYHAIDGFQQVSAHGAGEETDLMDALK